MDPVDRLIKQAQSTFQYRRACDPDQSDNAPVNCRLGHVRIAMTEARTPLLTALREIRDLPQDTNDHPSKVLAEDALGEEEKP